MSCPCNGMAAGGPFSCSQCQRQRKGIGARAYETKDVRYDFEPRVTASAAAPPVLDVIGRCPLKVTSLVDHGELEAEFCRTAVHEAGHAICAHAMGVQVKSVNPGPTRGNPGIGMVLYEDAEHPAATWFLIAAAGHAAEHFAQLSVSAPARELGGHDRKQIEDILDHSGVVGPARNQAIAGTVPLLNQIFADHVKGLNALTEILVKYPGRAMEGAVVHRILATLDGAGR